MNNDVYIESHVIEFFQAYELAQLTGAQLMLLVASETGHVYTFATDKLKPIIDRAEGQDLIETCLNNDAPSKQTSSENSKSFKKVLFIIFICIIFVNF